MRSIRVLAGLAVGALAFSACSSAPPAATTTSTSTTTQTQSSPSSDGTTPVPGGEPSASTGTGTTTGAITVWADDKRAAALKTIAPTIEGELGAKINVQAVSKDLQANFLTASQAGNAPDVVVGAHDWIGNLVQNGAISPVTLTDAAAFDKVAVTDVTYDGQVYGVPYTVNNIALIRNTDLAPEAPKTIEDMVATGKKLKDAGKTSEILTLQVGQNGDAFHMQPLVAAGGGSFFKYADGKWDPKTITLDSAETVAAMKKIQTLGEKGSGALKRSIGGENAISTFAAKKSPFLISGTWAIADIKKAGIKYDISEIPTWAEGGKPAAPFSGADAFYVAAKGKNAQLAQEFVTNYVSRPDVQMALYKAEPRPPALTAALDEAKKSDPDLQKFIDAGKNAIPMPNIPEMGAVWEPLRKAEAAIVGGADVTSTLKAAAATLKSKIK